jgi:integrase
MKEKPKNGFNAAENKVIEKQLRGGALRRRGLRSITWEVMLNGQRYRATYPTAVVGEAINAANREYSEFTAQDRAAAGLPLNMKMDTLLAAFRRSVRRLSAGAQRSYDESLKPLTQYFVRERGNPSIHRIAPADVNLYIEWRRDRRIDGNAKRRKRAPAPEPKPLAARTLAKDRAVLSAAFTFAEQHGYRLGNPVRLTKAPKGDKRPNVILSDGQYQRLIDACDSDVLRSYVVTLGETGMRADSEALWLQWDDINFEIGQIEVVSGRGGHRTKNGESRWIPMTDRIKAEMREHFARFRFSGSPWVFFHRISHGTRRKGERIGNLFHGFKGAASRAGLPGQLRQHDLRHRRVTTWLQQGESPTDVQRWMGHSTIEVTMAYFHYVPTHLRGLEAPQERAAGQ